MRIVSETDHQPDQTVWRYMPLSRFLEMLETSNLHFASPNQFEDPFEGAVAVQPFGFPVDRRYSEMDLVESAFAELRRLTKVCCWHIEDYESDAMWKLYSESGKGVAIVSTPERMDRSLSPYRIRPECGAETLWGGKVTYVDLIKSRLRVGDIERFYHKHRAFSWEREFRCAICLRMAEEFGVEVPEKGIFVQADMRELIQEVQIGPSLRPEDSDYVTQACESHRLGDRVHASSLLGRPRFA